MEHLYAPWRSNYIRSSEKGDECPLCLTNTQKYVLKRYEHCYVMLNLYPYNPGHLMVIPFEHTGLLHTLPEAARTEIMQAVTHASEILMRELKAEGINLGLNMGGKAAGGTIPEHLHMHVLPRFLGDTNFLPLLSETKQISVDLHELYERLKKVF